MNRLQSFLRNLRFFFTSDFLSRLDEQSVHIEDRAGAVASRMSEVEQRLETRADSYETAVDIRIDERSSAIDQRLDDYQKAIDTRLDAYQSALDGRIDDRLEQSERTLEERFADAEKLRDSRTEAYEKAQTERAEHFEKALTTRWDEFETEVGKRADAFESTTNLRLTEFESGLTERLERFELATSERSNTYEGALDARLEERAIATEKQIDSRLDEAEARLNHGVAGALDKIDSSFDERNRATDNRLDDRLARIERHIDTRFNTLEQRTDGRIETHERAVDGKLHQRSQDIVDRNDLMLQIFEQRLDKMRQELRVLRSNSPTASQFAEPGTPGSRGSDDEQTASDKGLNNGSNEGVAAKEPPQQLLSFRKLAESGAYSLSKIVNGPSSLYDQIIAWKKTAHEGLDKFAPDEEEIVAYILSFLTDQKEIDYVRQHLRRFVSTLGRVPPARRSSDRLLELGSLAHLAPAIRKYCGYQEVFCADLWDGEEKLRQETLRQKDGPDSYTIELRNFDVESDAFPYPDGHFRTVICCELIEHLRRDPMHMLWECNRVLAKDGYLLLTTPNIASTRAIEGLLVGCTPYLLSQYNLREVADQHNREFAPYEIGLALAAAGFEVVELETEDVWLRSNPAVLDLLKQIQISTELRGDNIFALARKKCPPIERYPKELYID